MKYRKGYESHTPSLRKALWCPAFLGGLVEVPRRVVGRHDVDIETGEIRRYQNPSILDVEVGEFVSELPMSVQSALEDVYGQELSERDRNLIVSGVYMTALILQKWVHADELPGTGVELGFRFSHDGDPAD